MDKNRKIKFQFNRREKLELRKDNVEVRLSKKTGLVVMAFLFLSVLSSFNLAYSLSATSLEELESQLPQENTLESRMASYRAALVDYIETHNITTNADLNQSSIDDLEKTVQSHMDSCNSAEGVESLKNDTSLQGDC